MLGCYASNETPQLPLWLAGLAFGVESPIPGFVPEASFELCGAPVVVSTPRQQQVFQLLCERKSLKEARNILKLSPLPDAAPRTMACRTARKPLLFCSLPRGHKGLHMLVNRKLKLTRLSFDVGQGSRGSMS